MSKEGSHSFSSSNFTVLLEGLFLLTICEEKLKIQILCNSSHF